MHGESALKYLIRANQGMVHQIARQLRPRGSASELDDMLQDGNMGLMQAVVRFEPSSGCRLSTYSYNWIRGLIMTGLHRCGPAPSRTPPTGRTPPRAAPREPSLTLPAPAHAACSPSRAGASTR